MCYGAMVFQNSDMTVLILPIVIAFAVTLAATPLVQFFGHRFGVMDIPNERSLHSLPTPRSGGVAILFGVGCAYALSGSMTERALGWSLAGTFVIGALGAIDDVRHFRAWPKFIIHIAAAAGVIIATGGALRAVNVPFGMSLVLGAIAVPVSVIWVVGFINCFNFMDGVNGIAAAQAVIGSAGLATIFWRAGDHEPALLLAAVLGAAAGFLPWNFPRGAIFMGDVGSASLGFLFGVLTLRAADDSNIIVAALPFFPFLLDSAVTVARRAVRGERFFSTPHRSHFYQRLFQTTRSHALVTGVWACLALISTIVAIEFDAWSDVGRVTALGIIVVLHGLVAAFIIRSEHTMARSLAEPRA